MMIVVKSVFKFLNPYVWIAIVVSPIVLSCHSSANKKTEQAFTKTLTLTDSVFFEIDSMTATVTMCVQYFKDDDDEFVFYLNMHTNSIYMYSYPGGKIIKKIRYAAGGPNGVGNVEGFTVHSFDSIVVASQYVISLSDTSGIPYFTWDLLKRNTDPPSGLAFITSARQALVRNKKIYVDIVPDVYTDDLKAIGRAHIKSVIDSENDVQKNIVRYPDLYRENPYSIQFLALVSSAYNPHTNHFVHSFPAYHKLVETDLDGKVVAEYEARSGVIKDIQPLSVKKPDRAERTRHFFQNPSYDKIVFDPYRKLYYRTVLLPVSDERFQNRDWAKQFSVIILDSAFQKIGEFIPDPSIDIEYTISFVNEHGYVMQKVEENQEDRMKFLVFTPVDISD